jgi:hypothetical protein
VEIEQLAAENLVLKQTLKRLEVEVQDLKEEIVRLKAFITLERKEKE